LNVEIEVKINEILPFFFRKQAYLNSSFEFLKHFIVFRHVRGKNKRHYTLFE